MTSKAYSSAREAQIIATYERIFTREKSTSGKTIYD